jgi:hypothetical protein
MPEIELSKSTWASLEDGQLSIEQWSERVCLDLEETTKLIEFLRNNNVLLLR